MSKICLLLILLHVIRIDAQLTKKVYSYFTKFECKHSEEAIRNYIHPNFTCYIKNYGKHFSTFNAYFAFKKPLDKFFFTAIFYYKSGTTYREVIKTPVTDYCVVTKSASSNIFIKQIVETCKQMAPDLVKDCPLRDSIFGFNITIPGQNFLSLLPSGDYKIFGSFTLTEDGPEHGNITVFGRFAKRN